ncbi:MAG TPA: hypothetical protein EYP43_01635 [Thermoplasmata archaeon]|nr:hypothetical protein [Thermoplasmata archaeon]
MPDCGIPRAFARTGRGMAVLAVRTGEHGGTPAVDEEEVEEYLETLVARFDRHAERLPRQRTLGYTGDEEDWHVEGERRIGFSPFWFAVLSALVALWVMMEDLLGGFDPRFAMIGRLVLLPAIVLVFLLGLIIGRGRIIGMRRWAWWRGGWI